VVADLLWEVNDLSRLLREVNGERATAMLRALPARVEAAVRTAEPSTAFTHSGSSRRDMRQVLLASSN